MLQRRYKFIAILLSLFIVLGLNILRVNAADPNSLQVYFHWEDVPASSLTIHLREKLEGQDGYLVIETVTTDQSSHLFESLDSSHDIMDLDVVVDEVPNYNISYGRTGNVIDVHLDKIYAGQLSFPAGQVDFTANGFPVTTDYPDFDFATTLTFPDGTAASLVNIMDDDGKITINGALEYPITRPGTYTLEVTQVNLGYQNFTFGDSIYRITYDVAASGFDLIVQSTTIYKDGSTAGTVLFVNSYVAMPVQIGLSASITTDPAIRQAEDFQIGMYDILPFGEFLNTAKSVSYPASSSADFEIMMYPGTTYQVAFKQIHSSSPYYTYDDNTFLVDLTTDRYGLVTMAITDDNGPVKAIVFTNTYEPEPTGIIIDMTKQITNFQAATSPAFSFNLVPDEKYQYATIKNDIITITCLEELTPGSFEIDFTQAGTYSFTVSEQPGSQENYRYDPSSFQVVIDVIDNQGILEATSLFLKENRPVDEIIFINEFEEIKVPLELESNRDDPEPVVTNEPAPATKNIEELIIDTSDNAAALRYAIMALFSLSAIWVANRNR